ncbi:unnamed protein product [Choristocarpus tenellus]
MAGIDDWVQIFMHDNNSGHFSLNNCSRRNKIKYIVGLSDIFQVCQGEKTKMCNTTSTRKFWYTVKGVSVILQSWQEDSLLLSCPSTSLIEMKGLLLLTLAPNLFFGVTEAFVGFISAATVAKQRLGASVCAASDSDLHGPDGLDGLVSRRELLRRIVLGTLNTAVSVAVLQPVLPSKAALPFFGGEEVSVGQEKVTMAAKFLQPVNKLEQDLRSGALKGGADDSAVVLRYIEAYLQPLRDTMLEAVPLLQLSAKGSKERADTLPLLMKGHIIELKMACKTGDPKEQLKEVEEVKETLEEFLSLVAKANYDISTMEEDASSQLSAEGDDAADKYMGVFGCKTFGMKVMCLIQKLDQGQVLLFLVYVEGRCMVDVHSSNQP